MQILTMTFALLSVFTFGLGGSTTTPRPETGTTVAPVSSHQLSYVAPGSPVQSATVSISNFKFEPKVLRVKVGTTVTWTNTDGTHTAVADGENFSSPTLSKEQTFSHKFTKRGKYPYYCSFHGSKGGGDMSGTIIVVP